MATRRRTAAAAVQEQKEAVWFVTIRRYCDRHRDMDTCRDKPCVFRSEAAAKRHVCRKLLAHLESGTHDLLVDYYVNNPHAVSIMYLKAVDGRGVEVRRAYHRNMGVLQSLAREVAEVTNDLVTGSIERHVVRAK